MVLDNIPKRGEMFLFDAPRRVGKTTVLEKIKEQEKDLSVHWFHEYQEGDVDLLLVDVPPQGLSESDLEKLEALKASCAIVATCTPIESRDAKLCALATKTSVAQIDDIRQVYFTALQ